MYYRSIVFFILTLFCLNSVYPNKVYAQNAQLVGYAILPADTFAEGPPTGQYSSDGSKLPEPRFSSQPVQGFSGVQFGKQCGSYLVITDNGFGTRNNSRDYLLRIYEITPELGTQTRSPGKVEVNGFIQLSDPAKHLPFTIVNQQSKDRFLTGADLDIESFVFDAQGQMWIGDEFGPYLLEFNTEGQLQNVPILLPAYATDLPFVQSTMNPMLSDDAEAQKNSNLGESRGIEGMAVSPDGYTLYPMLEGPVAGDADDALRIYEFDVRTKSFRPDKFYRYQLDNPEHAIGDMTVINGSEFLVIERDRKEGAEATFKKIFKINLAKTTNGYVEKTLVADLLNIDDPDNLGGLGETFTFPFITVENVLVLSADTILVINDNNYDGSGGRGPDVIDDNEIIMLQLSKPLALAEGVGRPLSCRD